MKALFTPTELGAISLKNRLVMAPLTRTRADADHTPNDRMARYYADRASSGLIISEATFISSQAVGYRNAPAIWNDQHVAGWKKVTEAVHQKGGKIVLQLWHVGRISDPELLEGNLPVSSSAVQPKGHVSLLRPKRDYVTPRALTLDEIEATINDYKNAAIRAKEAGFDGVEIHAANGYLIDQFLRDGVNKRTDQYGGSIPNRVRFLTKIVDALIPVWGADRIGIHLSPQAAEHDMHDSDPVALFTHVAHEMRERKIAFLFLREPVNEASIAETIQTVFQGPIIRNQDLTPELANQLIEEKRADAVSFGRLYIANADLKERLEQNAPLNAPEPATFYGQEDAGYLDYPTLK